MNNRTLDTIILDELVTVTGGNVFAKMTSKQALEAIQACSEQAYLQGASDRAIEGAVPGDYKNRSHGACNFGIDLANTRKRFLND